MPHGVVQRSAAPTHELSIVTRGHVPGSARPYAQQRLGAVIEHIDEPVLFARVKLTQAPDPARDRPAIAQVAVDVNGDVIRVQLAGHEMREAIDLLQARLRDKLEHRSQRRQALRRRYGAAPPGAWHHGDPPTARPEYFDRDPEEREVVRRKAYVIEEVSPDEAAFDMDLLGVDFYLFRDLTSHDDALLERTGAGTYRMTRLHPVAVDPGPVAVSLEVTDVLVPTLDMEQALERIGTGGERYLFFANSATGRGNVIYLRYDGHYGLIGPD